MIKYRTGDLFSHTGPRIIAHVCNDVGAWGAGFVLAVSERYPEAEEKYRLVARNDLLTLGTVIFAQPNLQVIVANMVAQRAPGTHKPLDLRALEQCLTLVGELQAREGGDVIMPRIGCGLAGGDWFDVEPIIQRTIERAFVYTLPNDKTIY